MRFAPVRGAGPLTPAGWPSMSLLWLLPLPDVRPLQGPGKCLRGCLCQRGVCGAP